MQPLHSVPDLPAENASAACPHEAELDEAHRKIENLEVALTTSRVISTAVGILLATEKVTADLAFGMLVVASQTRHTLRRAHAMLGASHDNARRPPARPNPGRRLNPSLAGVVHTVTELSRRTSAGASKTRSPQIAHPANCLPVAWRL